MPEEALQDPRSNKSLLIDVNGETYRVKGNTNGDMKVEISSDATIPTTIGDGTVSLSAGVAKQVSSTTVPCKKLWLSPDASNASEVRVGGSGLTVSTGKQLYQAEDFELEIDDLDKVYLISSSSATVTYMYTY